MEAVAQLETSLVEWVGPRIREYVPSNPNTHPALWVSELFASVKRAVACGDRQAMSLACEFIHRDPKLPFGKLIKSDLARELRRHSGALVESERKQLVAATVRLLALPYAPRELEDYAKLLRKLPREEYVCAVSQVVTKSAKAAQTKAYLLAA